MNKSSAAVKVFPFTKLAAVLTVHPSGVGIKL